MKRLNTLWLYMMLVLAVTACNFPLFTEPTPLPVLTEPVTVESVDSAPPTSQTSTDIPDPTVTETATTTPTFTPSPTPQGCGAAPPDDYTQVTVADGIVLSQRTISMLEYAQTLYGGTQNFLKAVTQGSYSAGLAASFGTHDGGGAVDLSVRSQVDFSVMYDELDAMILALRQAGFAAWVRDVGELYENSPIHIHAIAVGDADISEAAARQLTGPEGYFRGFNGLPVDPPVPDGWGEMIVCPWMIEQGYSDLRGASN